jgi:hypothetical protein
MNDNAEDGILFTGEDIVRAAQVILLSAGVIGFVGLMAVPQKPARSEAQLTPEHRAPEAKQRPDLGRGFLLVFDPSLRPVRYKTLEECQSALAAKGAGVCVNAGREAARP